MDPVKSLNSVFWLLSFNINLMLIFNIDCYSFGLWSFKSLFISQISVLLIYIINIHSGHVYFVRPFVIRIKNFAISKAKTSLKLGAFWSVTFRKSFSAKQSVPFPFLPFSDWHNLSHHKMMKTTFDWKIWFFKWKMRFCFFHLPAAILNSVKIKNERTLLQFCICFLVIILHSLV